MKAPKTAMIHHAADRTQNSRSQTARNLRLSHRPKAGLMCIGVLIIFVALTVAALSFPSSSKVLPNPLPPRSAAAPAAVRNGAVAVKDRNVSLDTLLAEQNRDLAFSWHAADMFVPMPQAHTDPTVSFYEADCTTPRTIFSPGSTVCARIDGLDTNLFTTHFDWLNPDGEVKAASTNITADGQTRTFILAPTASVGGWQANIIDQGGTPRAIGNFTVSDAANPAVDLSLNVDGPLKVTAGNDVKYSVVLFNYGPDSAQNVVLKDNIPANTTGPLIAQTTGPVFDCTHDTATTTCTIESMPAGSVAIFSITYTVDAGTPADTLITNTAEVYSDTKDRNDPDDPEDPNDYFLNSNITEENFADNVDSGETLTSAAPCVVSCPTDIVQQADVGQAGAIVTYTAPEASGSCGVPPPGETVVTCSQDSGTFFPVGTTVVNCAGPSGDACHFSVTVENPGGLSISLNGQSPMTAECGSGLNGGAGFNDPGATAINASGQSVPVTVTGNVDVGTNGSYTVTYTATEGQNSVSTTRTVNVDDTTPPIINVDGANPYKIQQGSCMAFVDPGATATDGCAGPKPVTRTVSGPGGATFVDPNTPGTYSITYTATDETRSATATRTVIVGNFPEDEADQPASSMPPTITLNGDDQMTVECGSFTDPGATATVCGGSVPVTTSGAVDPNTPGTYTITYAATSGGSTSEASRVVTVVDTTAPTIEILGANPMIVECHSAFSDPGATAHDACEGDSSATPSGTVDPNTVGTYTITYTATDASGHAAAPVTRTVNVVDTTPPEITLNGSSPTDNSITVECHTSFTDPGATAADACGGPVAVTASGTVDVNTVGTYTIVYSATDGTNPATKSRTVNVVDTTAPTLTCPSNVVVSLPLNSTATSTVVTYPAANATDSCASNVGVGYSQASGSIFPVGTTTVTVTATDASNNTSTCTFTATVLYNFTGFFSPVDNLPTLNVANAGKAIPVKFSLSGNKGLDIFASNSPYTLPTNCDGSAPQSDIEETVNAGGSSLSYTASSDQYNYVWTTQSSWAGTCRQLVMKLNDGSSHVANFKFK